MPVLADDDVVRGGQLDAKEYTEEPNSARLAFFALERFQSNRNHWGIHKRREQ